MIESWQTIGFDPIDSYWILSKTLNECFNQTLAFIRAKDTEDVEGYRSLLFDLCRHQVRKKKFDKVMNFRSGESFSVIALPVINNTYWDIFCYVGKQENDGTTHLILPSHIKPFVLVSLKNFGISEDALYYLDEYNFILNSVEIEHEAKGLYEKVLLTYLSEAL